MKGFYPEDKWVEANGLRMHYLDWGGDRNKKPLVLVHGIGGHAHMFDDLAPKFSDDWHVVALDSRGCGDTDWSPHGYSAQSQAEDIASFSKDRSLSFWLLRSLTGFPSRNATWCLSWRSGVSPNFGGLRPNA